MKLDQIKQLRSMHEEASDILFSAQILISGNRISPELNDDVKLNNLIRNYDRIRRDINLIQKDSITKQL